MPAKFQPEKFLSNNLSANATLLEARFGLRHDSNVYLKAFLVETPNEFDPKFVGPKKYKTAMFLLYLAELTGHDRDWTGSDCEFVMTDELRAIVRLFYGDKICKDATTNLDTIHTSVRDLLNEVGETKVQLYR